MDLLERYLRQIERYLPFKERSETTKELRNLILDQLDEAVNNGLDKETTLYNIIVEMGDQELSLTAFFLVQRALVKQH
jgi:hypothetical protein